MNLLKELFRFLAGILVPVAMIAAGGTLVGFGMTSDGSIILVIGLCFLAAGILWGAYLLYY